MNEQPPAHPDYDSLQSIFRSIVQWVINCRHARDNSNDLANCGSDEVGRIARDLGLHPSDLAVLAKKRPDAADLLRRLLVELAIDPNNLDNDDPWTMCDLQRLCSTCADKRQCQLDLANGVIAASFRDYCPNAFTLDALSRAKQ